MASANPTALPLPRTPRPTEPIPYTLTEAALALPPQHTEARQLLADLEAVDYSQLREWDVVELLGRTQAILADLIDTAGGGR